MRQRGRGRMAETGDSGFDGGSAILCAPRGNWSNQSRCLCRGAGCLASILDMTRYPRITRSLLLAFKHGFLRLRLVLINSGSRGLKCCKLCCRVSSARSWAIVILFSEGCWSVEKHFVCTCCYIQEDFVLMSWLERWLRSESRCRIKQKCKSQCNENENKINLDFAL